jgi:hypothetical protein
MPLGLVTGPNDGNMAWNYDAWVQAMFEVGYQGYVCYEGCTPSYQHNGRLIPIEVMDERVQMGRQFMLQLFEQFSGSARTQEEVSAWRSVTASG